MTDLQTAFDVFEEPTSIVSMPLISRDLADLGTPGVQVELTPEEAEMLGVVEETAVSLADIGEEAEVNGH